MKGKKPIWRIGLALTLLLMAFSALGGGVIARDAFDDDYRDCPSSSRVDAIENLRVVRGAEADELIVSWDRINVGALGLDEGQLFNAQITVIAESSDEDPETQTEALGNTETKFEGIAQASNWDVSVALTHRKYVISHIVKHDFKSGLGKPKLFDSFYYVLASPGGLDDEKYLKGSNRELQLQKALDDDLIKEHDKGTFYYLGFNHNFDNYYVNTGMTNPVTPKFRIGLVHELGIDPDDADFDHFRVALEDDSGDDVLGFQAATVPDSSIYGDDTVIVFGSVGTGRRARTQFNMASVDAAIYAADGRFTNIKTANTIDADEGGRLDAVYTLTDANWRQYFNAAGNENDNGPQVYGQAPKMWEGDTTLTLSLPSSTTVPIEIFTGGSFQSVNRYQFSLAVTAGTELGQNLSYANLMPAHMLGEDGADTGLAASDNIPYHQNGGIRRLFARAPNEYYDVAPSALSDDGSYTITVWAENDDDEIISPTATLTFNIQDEKDSSALSSNLLCFNSNTNQYGPRPMFLPTNVYGLSRNVILGLIDPLADSLCSRITDDARAQIRGLINNLAPPGLPTVGTDTTSSGLTYSGRVVGITIEEK